LLRKKILQQKPSPSRTPTNNYKEIVSDVGNIEQYSWQWVTQWKMKKVIDKRILETGLVEYLVSWEDLDNTWEPADTDSLTCQELIVQYEHDVSRRKAIEDGTNTRLKSAKVCQKHPFKVDSVIGAIKLCGKLKYLVQLQGTLTEHFVTSSEAQANFPDKVIQYLEKRIEWQ
jgi:hypothetical protein